MGNPSDQLDEVLLSGEITDARKELGFFETPEVLAADIVRRAGVTRGMRVLEPQAGSGRIARAARDLGAQVECVEIDPGRHSALRTQGFSAVCADFLTCSPTALPPFGAIAMNSPFAKQQDVAHVRHAFEFLAPGGSLASVASAGVRFREDRKAKEFRAWVDGLGGKIEDLPDGTFKESGTGVSTVLVTLKKTR